MLRARLGLLTHFLEKASVFAYYPQHAVLMWSGQFFFHVIAPEVLMRTSLCLLPLTLGSFLLFACAPVDTEERLSRLEAQMQAQQVADLRLAHVEDRLADMEGAIGELRGNLSEGKGSGARTVPGSPKPVAPAPMAQDRHPAVGQAPPVMAPAVVVLPATPVAADEPAATPLGPASSPVANAMADLAAQTGTSVPGLSTARPSPASSGQSGAHPAVPYPQDPLLSGSAPITQPLPGMVFSEEYQLMPGGRRVVPVTAGPDRNAASAAAQTASVPGPASADQAMKTPPVSSSQAQRTAASSDKTAYASALALYEHNQPAAAEKAFNGFLQQYPQSPLVPNAMYWLGECYYSTDRMDNAIMIFKDVASKFPKHDKAAASLLKAGYAYAKMGDMENAYFYWQILLDDFPGSAPATLARKRMAGR